MSLLYLGKIKSGIVHKLDLLPKLIAGYQQVLTRLRDAGVEWVQIDEPILALELDAAWRAAFEPTYQALAHLAPKLLLATYFDQVREHSALLRSLPVAGVHLDLVRGADQLPVFLQDWPQDRVLSAGVVDGRNIWRADLESALALLQPLHAVLGERLWVSASCSLLHVPVDLAHENKLDAELRDWLAFATQKVAEITALKRALRGEAQAVSTQFTAAALAIAARKVSPRIHNPLVQKRLRQIDDISANRNSVFAKRIAKQQARFNLPAFPTTNIGSFPQTTDIRQALSLIHI